MLPYERVMEVFRGGTPDRIPCVNFASVITKEFLAYYNANWVDIYQDPEKMASVASAAHRLCGLDNISLPFDQSVEAELLGIKFDYHPDGPPTPLSFLSEEQYFEIVVPHSLADKGRMPVIQKAIKRLKEEFGGRVPINVIVSPPMTTVAGYLLGPSATNLMMRRFPGALKGMLEETFRLHLELVNLYEEWGADIITLHDPKGSPDVLNPGFFDSLVLSYHKSLIEETKLPTVVNVCGNIIHVLEKIISCNPSAIVFDYKTPVKSVMKALSEANKKIPVAGNLSPFWDIYLADDERMEERVVEVIKGGVDFVSPGCDLWVATPIEKLRGLVSLVEKYGKIR
ncbi:MAG: hypothetical protein B9J98_06560 [Candidatus Terraquivivens tikiterensis]|uniref:Uroporphyrinogen decarboxylase (URO-D) domain-containing protein n=1 Tax=Candidatus Terraquivivens tikiterensis TaxID=1980982 RepID=A0A2R7Y236_9ARCH|nr:MAG: hypothetical protein B9J98_06560 [Candidatus Terraquivivens tikiterensis]